MLCIKRSNACSLCKSSLCFQSSASRLSNKWATEMLSSRVVLPQVHLDLRAYIENHPEEGLFKNSSCLTYIGLDSQFCQEGYLSAALQIVEKKFSACEIILKDMLFAKIKKLSQPHVSDDLFMK